MLTVKELADLIVEDNILLVAGEKGMEKTIDYINVKEIASKSPWMKPNGFLMTTFHSFENIEEIVKELTFYLEMGISGIGFHTAVYKEIPRKIIDFANKNAFPLFKLPPGFAYYQLFERVNSFLHGKTLKLKEQTDKVNESMLNAVILEKDTHEIISMIGKYVKVPVIYLNQDYDIISIWGNQLYTRAELQKLVTQIIDEESKQFEYVKIENKYVDTNTYELSSGSLTLTIIPVISETQCYGFLLVAIPEDQFSFHYIVIKHGITALLLDGIKRNAMKDFLKNKDIHLFEDIFHNDSQKELDAKDFIYPVASIKHLFIVEFPTESNIKDTYRLLEIMIKKCHKDSFMWISNKQILGFLPNRIVKEMCDLIRKEIPYIKMGISGRLQHFSTENLKKLFEQASLALSYVRQNNPNNNIAIWDSLKLNKVVHHLNTNHLMKDYGNEILQPLIDYDYDNGSELTKTLYTYLKNFFKLKESSDELYVHPNTVKYRISKVKEILPDINLADPNEYMSLMLALKMYFSKEEQELL